MIEQLYKERCKQVTDINEHLPVLRELASQVDHVTEFGVREGHSTVAFATALPNTLISYDINRMPPILEAAVIAYMPRFAFKFIRANVLKVEIEPTDLLFIDSYHTYEHLNREFELHSNKVNRFLVFHDTETFGTQGEDGSTPGLMAAVDEFMAEGDFNMTHYPNNNGLTILERA